MIRAIIFDFGQTLVDSADGFRTAEKEAQKKLCGHLFPDKTADDAREIFLPVYRRMRKSFHERSEFSRAVLWRALFDEFSVPPDPAVVERWETDYWARVKSMTTPFPETLAVLALLSENYLLSLITNTQGQRAAGNHRIALFPDLETYFHTIVVAGESGVPPKPHPAAFRACLEKMGLAPGEAVFVGDDYRIDIGGARDAGLHPVWIQHRTVQRNWPAVETDVPVITALDQLARIVARISV